MCGIKERKDAKGNALLARWMAKNSFSLKAKIEEWEVWNGLEGLRIRKSICP